MSGAIVAVMVKPGDKVAQGAPLIVLEAMKMEHTIVAPADGVVASVNFGVGDRVAEGADLVDLEDAEAGRGIRCMSYLSLPATTPTPWLELFRAALPGAELVGARPDAACGSRRAAGRLRVTDGRSATLFDEQQRLKAIFTLSAGVGHLLRLRTCRATCR